MLVNDKKYNFSDFEALSKLKDQKKIRDIKKYRFTGNPNKKEKSFHSNLLVIGPSHIQRWLSRIESGKLPEPDYELWGIGGLSIYSQSIQNLCQFWLSHDDNNKILVFVPDFRIGNSVLYEKSSNAMFIYKNLMSSISADSKLKQKTFDILDRLTYKYKERVKFLFWCQYGRQMINIRAGKYIDPNNSKLKQKTFDILDRLTYKYKERVKFLFWCQYGRQMINIRAGKYIDPNIEIPRF